MNDTCKTSYRSVCSTQSSVLYTRQTGGKNKMEKESFDFCMLYICFQKGSLQMVGGCLRIITQRLDNGVSTDIHRQQPAIENISITVTALWPPIEYKQADAA